MVEHNVLNPSGEPGIYGVVKLKNLAVGVLPIDRDGSTYLVGQYRFPGEYYSWELPEGGGAMDQEPVVSAKRELLEETGLVAAQWSEFITMDLSNAISDERAIGFLAWDLEQHPPEPESDERIVIRRVAFKDALDMAMTGEIRCVFTQAMLFKAALMVKNGDLPDALARRLGN